MSSGRAGVAIAVATVIGACRPAPGTSTVSPTASASNAPPPDGQLATATAGEPVDDPKTPKDSRRAAIEYTMHNKPFPLPIVKGTIAGQPVRMMIDTGANSHILAGWFVRKANLTAKKLGGGGTDHAGTKIETFRVEKPEIAIDDWGKLSATSVIATEIPKAIEKLGIAAFLSPQALVTETDAVVLDLARAELRAAPWDEAKAELAQREGWVPLFEGNARLCEQKSGAIHVLSYVIPAFVDSQRVSLLVDTGAQHSDIFATSTAGKKLAPQSVPSKEAIYTAAGGMDTKVLEGVSVSTGTFSVKSDVDIIAGGPDAWCPRDGVVAMDLLRSCALLLGKNKLDGRCEKPKK